MRQVFFSIALLSFTVFSGFLFFNEPDSSTEKKDKKAKSVSAPAFMNEQSEAWADSILQTMSLEEKIGQLFMVAAYSNRDEAHQQDLDSLIENYHIGGLIFFQGSPTKQVEMTNHFQAKSKIPLMIGIDGEWGLAMRLDSTIKYPKQMTLGAIQDNDLIYAMGKQVAEQCQRMGIHINFAPVADINNNPDNPVINYRSFGEDRQKVTLKSLAYMNGMQDQKLLTSGKHFPGHGDTDADSHKTLPIISHDLERLDTVEFVPFRHMIDSGLTSMMVAHLYIPSLDKTPNRASTLSKKVVTDLLQTDLGFQGLIFTDALNMRGVSAYFDPGQLEVAALEAGNDVLLFPENVPAAVVAIKSAIDQKKISIKEIDAHCKKILQAKHWVGLNKFSPIETKDLVEDLNQKDAVYLNQRLFESALTVIKNDNELLPIRDLSTKTIATVNIGVGAENTFSSMVDRYCSVTKFDMPRELSYEQANQKVDELKGYNTVIVSTFDMSQRPYQNFGFTKETNDFINLLAMDSSKTIILNVMGNPYCLEKMDCTDKVDAIVINYEEREETESLSAQLIFGGITAQGVLPVSIGDKWTAGHGLKTTSPIRMKYTLPEELGIKDADLVKIDEIVQEGLDQGVFPGCQILAAKDGKVFLYKGYGKHTYEKDAKPVEVTDIYDLASITKIASSTASIMKLQDEGQVHVDSTLDEYLHDMVDSTDYEDITLKQMMTHQAGFKAWIPFYIRTLHKGQPKIELYSIKQTDFFNLRVAEDLYIHDGVRDSIFQRILSTDVSSKKKYLYSDLGYYFLNEIIQRKTGMTQDQYVDQTFYKPLGLDNIGYKPRDKWDISRIPPTEDDQSFRHQIIHADVHDQGAAMLGGVCGHAGLFANANDLGVMMQMFMQYGRYGGERYIDQNVVKQFTSSPYYDINRNRRGIGFDKPVRGGGNGPTCSGCASDASFGHSGFTGTLTWADPETGLVFVFLSNRTFPDAENRQIISLSTRTRIMQVLYDAIATGEERLAKVNS
ncbi:glycoside hydrolase family 3 N-terminal domain-containing protein [Parvicella tangerina]|uniref:beta-N-acetylhexosaminidase n=1 Tax=Parvicella tangerina TaxID=2829795 RepID=A0A916JLK3_9FLAO|nr:glycoside hydrolase family 3 N-terminal domain-containing protein [Parvicella tangerina]CAG5080436.1 Beta-hexosaminidase [Parvicella tangerina]